MVRAFEDTEIIHTEAEIDPIRDMEIIKEELLLKDIEFLEKKENEVDGKLAKYPSDKEA